MPAAVAATSSTASCAHCAAPLRPAAAFCGRCGTPAQVTTPAAASEPQPSASAAGDGGGVVVGGSRPPPAATPCPHCDAPLRPGAVFCGRCGKSVNTPGISPAAAAAPAGDVPPPSAARPDGLETLSPPHKQQTAAPAGEPLMPASNQELTQCQSCAAPVRPSALFCAACGTSTLSLTAANKSPAEPVVADAGSHRDVQLASAAVAAAPQAATRVNTPLPALPLVEPPASTPTAAPQQAHRAAANQGGHNRRKPMIVALAAIAVIAVVLGGVAWWRSRAPSAPADTVVSAAPEAPQPQPQPTPAATAAALPFAGEWIVANDSNHSRQLPDPDMITFSPDRLRFKGETREVRYLKRGEGRFGIRFTAAAGGQSRAGQADGNDAFTVFINDADHLTFSNQHNSWALVRGGAAAAVQPVAAKASALPPLPPAAKSVERPKVAPAPSRPPAVKAPAVTKAEPSPVQLAIKASLDEGFDCMVAHRYDCAISSANAVLRLAPGNTVALKMKRDAEAEQARALSEIEIR